MLTYVPGREEHRDIKLHRKATFKDCEECVALLDNYERAIAHIKQIVASQFDTRRAKLTALHEWQDKRDVALATFYRHRERHVRSDDDQVA